MNKPGLNFLSRIKLATMPKNELFQFLQKYAEEYIKGEDSTLPGGSSVVTPQQALTYSAVFACNRVLSETLASCPVFLYEKNEDGSRKAVTDSNAYELLHYGPNPEMTPLQFKEFGVTNINLGGNFIAQKIYNLNGNLMELRPIAWNRVRIDIDKESGKLLYFIDNAANPRTRAEILHIPGITLDGYIGITPIEYVATTIDIGISQDKFEGNFYKNRASTSGVFQYPGPLSDTAFDRLKKDIKKNYTGLRNAGVPMILEEGGVFKEITMKLTDAQFIESKRFRIEDVARIYRVPLHLLQNLDRATNNNIEHQSLEFVMYTMLSWYKRWEENLNMQTLDKNEKKRGRYFEFKIDSLLRGDAVARANAYATGRQWGWLSVNDIRRLENMVPIPNGGIYLQPMNMVEAGKTNVKDQHKALAEEIYNRISEKEKNA